LGRTTVYNNIYNKEDWAKVCKFNKELFEEWKFYLISIGRAESSIKQYGYDIRILLIFLMKYCDNKMIVDLNKRDIIKFQSHSINKWGHSPNRTRRLKSCLSSVCNYIECILDDLYPDFKNVVNKIESPTNQPIREKTILTNEQVQNILDTLVKSKQYQKACVFALAANSGCRLSELLRFKLSYFNKDNLINDAYYKTPEKIRIKGRGKQGYYRYKFVFKIGFQEYFDLWLNERQKLNITCDELFVTRRNGEWIPAQNTTLQSWTIQYSKILGTNFYFHSLRHFLVSKLRNYNIPDKIIKEWFGWKNIDMIEVYDDNEAEDSFEEFFTADGIKKIEKNNLNDIN
jgi:integrase